MKIALFYNLYFSGAKRTVFEHAKGLLELGHTIDVYTLDDANDIFSPGNIATKEFKYEYKRKTISLPFVAKATSDLSDFLVLKNLHKKIAYDIDERKYNIALIHTDQITQAPFVLKFLKTKNVYFCLEPLKMGSEYSFDLRIEELPLPNKIYEKLNLYIRKRIDRTNARSAGSTFAISKFGRELMIANFDLYPKISYLGVDVNLFRNRKLKKKNQILFVGQKLGMNGFDYANKVMSLIPEKVRPSLKVVSIKKGGKRLTDEEVVRLYNESLITLSLSNFDTFGLVPLESMACGTPVVAFDVAGYRETISDGKTGYLVGFDAQELADKITYLLTNKEVLDEMGNEGIEWVKEKWTWEYQIKNLEKLLSKKAGL